jgi:hypothetical protein
MLRKSKTKENKTRQDGRNTTLQDKEKMSRPKDMPHCAIEMHLEIYFARATLYINLQGKCRAPKPGHTLSASLPSRNALQHFTRATLYGNLKGKCRAQKPGHTLYASLRSRNALQHFTRATLYGNLQVKCRAPAGAP